jgi:hypothetical protein
MKKKCKGNFFELKERPQLYFGNPTLTVGKKYLVKDIDGSNFIIDDDDNHEVSIGSCRFVIDKKNNYVKDISLD